MPVLDRDALQGSPLADLHLIAAELGLDGFRRLRKEQLVDAILERQGGAASRGGESDAPDVVVPDSDSDAAVDAVATDDDVSEDGATDEDAPRKPARRRRGGRGRSRTRDADDAVEVAEETESEVPGDDENAASEETAEGTIEVLGNGSGFVRVSGPEPSEEDAYISAAQVRRCELVSGDVITGPVRSPRRSERYRSLIRVETINGRSADEVAGAPRFDDLPATWPTQGFRYSVEDPTLQVLAQQTPFGRGSRVVISGPARSGKSEALRRLALALTGPEDVQVEVVLLGVRPEEAADWTGTAVEPTAALTFAAAPEARAQALERALDQARRVVSRGADAVLLVDSLDELPDASVRKTLAAARNVADGGSLTVVATATVSPGGETTAIVLDPALAGARRFPALDLRLSGTLRPELLVGEEGAEAIARARAELAN